MPSAYPVGLIEVDGETLALSSTLASLGVPLNAYQAIVYNPATDFRLKVNPALIGAVFYDASNSAGSRFEQGSGTSNSLLRDLIDRDTGTGTGTAMDASTTADFLYLCFSGVIGGIRIVIGDANAETAGLDVEYRKNDDTWAALTDTDGTDSGGATLAQTGNVTWTAPTDWKRAQLGGAQGIATDADAPSTEGMWLRLSWDAALGANVEIDEIWALNKDTDRGYLRAATEYHLSFDRRNVGAIEAVLASGTDTLEVTWMKVAGV